MCKSVDSLIRKTVHKKVPNQETLQAIADIEEEKDLVEAEDVLDLFDALDI